MPPVMQPSFQTMDPSMQQMYQQNMMQQALQQNMMQQAMQQNMMQQAMQQKMMQQAMQQNMLPQVIQPGMMPPMQTAMMQPNYQPAMMSKVNSFQVPSNVDPTTALAMQQNMIQSTIPKVFFNAFFFNFRSKSHPLKYRLYQIENQ